MSVLNPSLFPDTNVVVYPASNTSNIGNVNSESNLTEIVKRITPRNYVLSSGYFSLYSSSDNTELYLSPGIANIQGYNIDTLSSNYSIQLTNPSSSGVYYVVMYLDRDPNTNYLVGSTLLNINGTQTSVFQGVQVGYITNISNISSDMLYLGSFSYNGSAYSSISNNQYDNIIINMNQVGTDNSNLATIISNILATYLNKTIDDIDTGSTTWATSKTANNFLKLYSNYNNSDISEILVSAGLGSSLSQISINSSNSQSSLNFNNNLSIYFTNNNGILNIVGSPININNTLITNDSNYNVYTGLPVYFRNGSLNKPSSESLLISSYSTSNSGSLVLNNYLGSSNYHTSISFNGDTNSNSLVFDHSYSSNSLSLDNISSDKTLSFSVNGLINSNSLNINNGKFTIDNNGNIDSFGSLVVTGSITSTSGGLSVQGNIISEGTITGDRVYNAVYNDYADFIKKDSTDIKYEPGDIISKKSGSDTYVLANNSNKRLVVGVYSDTYGHVLGGDKLDNMEDNEINYIPIAVAGNVFVKVIGEVYEGDLITTSNINGVGVVSKDPKNDIGCIIGKALESKSGNNISKIKIQVMLS